MSSAKGQVVDKYLSGIVQGFKAGNCVGDLMFPVAPTDQTQGKYIMWDAKSLKAPDTSRGLGAAAKRTDYDYTRLPWALPPGYTGEVSIDRREVAQAKPVPNLDLAKNKLQIKKADMDREKELKAAAIGTNAASYGSLTGNVSGAGSGGWGAAGTDIYGDLETKRWLVAQAIGELPNKLFITPDVWAAMRKNTSLKNFFYNTTPGAAAFSNKEIAALFGLEDIIVCNATYTDSTNTTKYVWGTAFAALIYNRPQAGNGLIDPTDMPLSFGYTLQLDKHPFVDYYYDEPKRSDVWGVNDNYVHLLTSTTSGYLFTSVLT